MGGRRHASARQVVAAELADLRHRIRRADRTGEVIPDTERATIERRIAWLGRHLAEIDAHRAEHYGGREAGTRARHA